MRLSALAALLALAACGSDPLRISVPPVTATDSVAVAFDSIEVLEVSLPAYADGDGIFVQGPGGALVETAGAVWADDPARAMTLDLSRALNDLSSARVAPEPWPYDEPAEARVDVRVSEFAPDLTRNAFVLRGQYFVAAYDDSGRDRARDFLVEGVLPPDAGPAAIASARAAATHALARQIVSDGLR